MKTFKVGLSAINAEKMWNFAEANQVHVRFVKSVNPAGDLSKTVYVYEFLMTPETYTAFALSVPVVLV